MKKHGILAMLLIVSLLCAPCAFAAAGAEDGLPAITLSAGAAHGAAVAGPTEWFNHADKALYRTKRDGRRGVTLFESETAART